MSRSRVPPFVRSISNSLKIAHFRNIESLTALAGKANRPTDNSKKDLICLGRSVKITVVPVEVKANTKHNSMYNAVVKDDKSDSQFLKDAT